MKDTIVQWIRTYFEKNGPNCDAVIGISGGKDSSVVAALCVEALGKDRVVPVLMPDGEQSDIADSWEVIDHLGLRDRAIVVNIEGVTDAFFDALCDSIGGVSAQSLINIPPRVRMAMLYAISQTYTENGGRVANTCNLSEEYIGYSTKYGDAAGDFAPIYDLLVHEVVALGKELGLPDHLVDKTPSDGLCGVSDEDNLGFTYHQVGLHYCYGTCGDEDADKKIAKRVADNMHKRVRMPFPRIKTATIKGIQYDGVN